MTNDPRGTAQPVFHVDETGRVAEVGTVSFVGNEGTWVDFRGEDRRVCDGLPPEMAFAAPSGYVGARIAQTMSSTLGVPAALNYWSDDDRVRFLCRTGHDVAGSLMWGADSLAAHTKQRKISPIAESDCPSAYLTMVNASLSAYAATSAGGAQPKFACETKARGHLIVKFEHVGTRSAELLVLEELALRSLAHTALPAATARYLEHGEYAFLEIERFDRVGRFGRRGMISAGALDDEWFGRRDHWPAFGARCLKEGWLSARDVQQILVLVAFSELIGNTDRHFENLSLLTDAHGRPVAVAPAYDMLPMIYASIRGGVEPALRPITPNFATLGTDPNVFRPALDAARIFWNAAAFDGRLSASMRKASSDNVAVAMRAVKPLMTSGQLS